MSAIRVGHGVYVDPWTRMEITGPQPLPTTPESPVIRRRATPEELARLDDSPPRIIDAIGLVPRPIRGRYTDAERKARKQRKPRLFRAPRRAKVTDEQVFAALREASGNRSAAARALGVSVPCVSERLDVTRRWGVLPEDVATLVHGRARVREGVAS